MTGSAEGRILSRHFRSVTDRPCAAPQGLAQPAPGAGSLEACRLNSPLDHGRQRAPGLETSYTTLLQSLSPFRIRSILLVSSLYDHFILEEDGRLDDLMQSSFAGSGAGVPGIRQVSGGSAALDELASFPHDLVICVMRLGDMDLATFARRARETRPGIPVVLLAWNTPELDRLMALRTPDSIDRIFVWQGDGRVVPGIVRLVEDERNAAHDARTCRVQNLLLVEDSVFFYSRYAFESVALVEELMEGVLSREGLSPAQRSLRARARPKVLLATSYEEALELAGRFQGNLLGVVTDMSFPVQGRMEREAGLRLIAGLRAVEPSLPVILQTSEPPGTLPPEMEGVTVLSKDSPTLMKDLRRSLSGGFGFGPLVFRGSDGSVVSTIENVEALYVALEKLPADAVLRCAGEGRLQRWLRVHAELDLASRLDALGAPSGPPEEFRGKLAAVVRAFRSDTNRGTVPAYSRAFYEDYARFSRIGSGSIGGKGRGLAFMDRILTSSLDQGAFPGVEIAIPRTLVLTTEVFEEFVETNGLLEPALQEERDLTIIGRFLKSDLPPTLLGDLRDFAMQIRTPLAVRSSSLLEDALYQPFAGIYATKMLPNNAPSFDERFRQLVLGIKFVFASTYLRQARAYIESTGHRVEEERMAALIQSVVGVDRGERFYPHFSGVGRSYNYYPAGQAVPEDGVVNVAIGLGKTIVDGGVSVRFTPKYPRVLPQFGTVADMLKHSQRSFWSVNMMPGAGLGLDDYEDQFLASADLAVAELDGVLDWTASTYSPENEAVYEGITMRGPRVIDFGHILRNGVFPLAEITGTLLSLGQRAMNCPVEMEFAVNLGRERALPAEFFLLQMRPMVAGDDLAVTDLEEVPAERILCASDQVLGNGVTEIADILYVKPEAFDAALTRQIAREIDGVNASLARDGRKYLLAGPGRWGSSDPWLGIPVNWSAISAVRAIVEAGLPGMNPDPSQGSHFFQNMTSLRIPYFTVTHGRTGHRMDWDWLASLPHSFETEHTRAVRTGSPLRVVVDGRTGRGVILKPE